MMAKNLDLLNVIFIKVEDNLLSNLFSDIQFKIVSFY